MTLRLKRWRGPTRAALVLATAALVPLPALAGESTSSSAAAHAPVSLRQAVARAASATTLAANTSAATTAPVARRDEQNSSGKQSTGFFAAAQGMIVLAVMGAGTGYTIYSASHNRIKSPRKESGGCRT